MRFEGSPTQFESTLKLLFERMGFSVQLTKFSHDGGVDLNMFDPTPFRGGRFIVQAKRYEGSVGEPVIRDLYGTLMHEGAVKAILVTTGYFTSGAIAFANGKPIELCDGKKLNELFKKYNLEAAIHEDAGSTQIILNKGVVVDEHQERIDHFKAVLTDLKREWLGPCNPKSYQSDFLKLRFSSKTQVLNEIDKALSRTEDGSYGVCESCGKHIPLERLVAFPAARLCVSCGKHFEAKQ